jgi:hypothetical protein
MEAPDPESAPESKKSLFFSLLAGNWPVETGSALASGDGFGYDCVRHHPLTTFAVLWRPARSARVLRPFSLSISCCRSPPSQRVSFRGAVAASKNPVPGGITGAFDFEREPLFFVSVECRVHHLSAFARLEDQMCAFTVDFNWGEMGYSPVLRWICILLSLPLPTWWAHNRRRHWDAVRTPLADSLQDASS